MIKLISTTAEFKSTDRDENQFGHMEIQIQVTPDHSLKQYRFDVADYLVQNPNTEKETSTAFLTNAGAHSKKTYSRTYADFDAQMAQLRGYYPNSENLTESEYNDFLIIQGCLIQLVEDPIGNYVFIDKTLYVPPVTEEA